MKSKNIAVAVAALIGLASVGMQPASANDLTKILGSLGLRGNSFGGQNQVTIQSNISIGLSNLSSELQRGISSGQLTVSEQASLQAELDRISAMNDSFFSDGVYTASEVQQLLSAFNNMNSMIASAENNSATNFGTSYGYGYGNGYSNGYGNNGYGIGNLGYNGLGNRANVLRLSNQIRTNISTALANGEISSSQALSMRNQLNSINYQLNTRRLTGVSRNSLINQLVDLGNRVESLAGGSFYY